MFYMISVSNAYSLIGAFRQICRVLHVPPSSSEQPTADLLVDLLRGPAPYAFVGGHRAIGYFENRVA